MLYVLKCDNPQSPNDVGLPTRVRLVGPFASQEAAHQWATSKANNPHDNPIWQTVDLEGVDLNRDAVQRRGYEVFAHLLGNCTVREEGLAKHGYFTGWADAMAIIPTIALVAP